MAINVKAKRIKERFEKLKSNRYNWEQVWQETLELTIPRKAFVTRRREIQGERVREDLYDSTARRANQILAAGLQGNLTNPATRWFKLRMENIPLNEMPDVKLWLSESEDRMFDVLNGSNFHQQIHEYYLDLGSIGTAVMYEGEDPIDVIRFSTRAIDEVVIDENSRERIDTVYRKYKLTARQAFEKWQEDAGKTVIDFMEKRKEDDKIEFIHCVQPRDIRNPFSQSNKEMAFESIHINCVDDVIVEESGFNEFPFMATRFEKVAGDMYGYSPGVVMLPDIKMLNAVSKTLIRAAQKITDPPLIMPHDGFLLPLKLIPGGINYKLSGTADDKIEPLATGGNIPVGRDMQNDLRESINKGFFVDLFLTLADRRNMTATEVAERVSEKMLLLGPALGRVRSELLDPIIGRTFGIMLRRGILSPPPEILSGQELTIEYVSPLALAQKGEQVQAITNLMQLVGGVAQMKPEALDVINEDGIVRESANIYGVKPTILNSPEVVQETRAQRAQQQQLQAQMAMAAQGASTAKEAATAGKESATAEQIENAE